MLSVLPVEELISGRGRADSTKEKTTSYDPPLNGLVMIAKLYLMKHACKSSAPAHSFIIFAQGLRLALYKGLRVHRQGLYKRWLSG